MIDRLQHEFEAIGFYLSAHPLDAYGTGLRRLEVVRYGELRQWLVGRSTNRARLAGIVLGRQERTSAKGNRFAFVQLSDASGMYEAMVFSDTLSAARELLEPGKLVLLTADVRSEEELIRLTVQSVQPLDEAVATAAAGLKIFLRDPAPVDSLKKLMERERRGRGRVNLVLDIDRASEVEISLPGGWQISAATRAAIKAIPGIVDVQDV